MAASDPTDDEIAERLGMSVKDSDAAGESTVDESESAKPQGDVQVALEQMHTAMQGGNWKRAERSLRAAVRAIKD